MRPSNDNRRRQISRISPLGNGPIRAYAVLSGPRGTLFPPLGADLGVASLVFHQILPIPQEPGQARHSALPARSTQVLCQRPRTAMLRRPGGRDVRIVLYLRRRPNVRQHASLGTAPSAR